jgi:hypothetical protein
MVGSGSIVGHLESCRSIAVSTGAHADDRFLSALAFHRDANE